MDPLFSSGSNLEAIPHYPFFNLDATPTTSSFTSASDYDFDSDSDLDSDITMTSTASTPSDTDIKSRSNPTSPQIIPDDDLLPAALPSYPEPLPRPIFICRHTLGPLPVTYSSSSHLTKPFSRPSSSRPHNNSNIPPPPSASLLIFLHPCRACHFSFTETLVSDIFNRFRADLDTLDVQLDQVAIILAQGYRPDVARIKETLLKQKGIAMETRRMEIKEAWEGFKAVWGNWGNGSEEEGVGVGLGLGFSLGGGNVGMGLGGGWVGGIGVGGNWGSGGRAKARGRGRGKDGVWRNF